MGSNRFLIGSYGFNLVNLRQSVRWNLLKNPISPAFLDDNELQPFESFFLCSHIYPYFNKHLVKGSLNGIWLSRKIFSSKWVTFFCAKGRPSPRLDSGGAGGECALAAISRLRRFIAFSRVSRPSQPTKR